MVHSCVWLWVRGTAPEKAVLYVLCWILFLFFFLRCRFFKNRRTEKLNFCNDHKTEPIKQYVHFRTPASSQSRQVQVWRIISFIHTIKLWRHLRFVHVGNMCENDRSAVTKSVSGCVRRANMSTAGKGPAALQTDQSLCVRGGGSMTEDSCPAPSSFFVDWRQRWSAAGTWRCSPMCLPSSESWKLPDWCPAAPGVHCSPARTEDSVSLQYWTLKAQEHVAAHIPRFIMCPEHLPADWLLLSRVWRAFL